MAGYMTKLNGHVYEGGYYALETLENGDFIELNCGREVLKVTVDKDTIFRVVSKTELWGKPALDLTVVSVGEDEIYFVESEWDINDNVPFDEALYSIQAGEPVRMHRPLIGESLIVTVDDALYAALSDGDKVAPTAGGGLAVHL